jgi:23S rRNA (cytosine1962-C5)-methyltransferase
MKIIINKKGAQRVARGHPWVFHSDIVRSNASQPGVVQVFQEKGGKIGEALFSPKSQITLRMLTRGEEEFTEELILRRLQNALTRRETLFPNQNIYRMVFGEADHLPSLIIDRFNEVVIFQTLSAGMEVFKERIIDQLKHLIKPQSIIERNDSSVRQKEDLPVLRQSVFGEAPGQVTFDFAGKRFGFDPLEGQKTGFFLDQRFNAKAASDYARGKMLDAFSYVGQFAIHAASKVESITCVDASENAVAQLNKNISLNEYQNVQAVSQNVFDFLKDCDQKRELFDTISLDPPAFVKNRSSLKTAIRGYKEINLRAMKLMTPGGILITSSCSQHLSTERFEEILLQASLDTKRSIQILEKRGQPADHPILLSVPETHYLKCYILRVE